MKAIPRPLPPSDPEPIRINIISGEKVVLEKSRITPDCSYVIALRSWVLRYWRMSSVLLKSDCFLGRSKSARSNSVRARSQMEIWLRVT